MRRGAALRALALGLATLVLSARLAGQVIASGRAAIVPDGTSGHGAATLTGWRVDPVAGHTELSIAAAGAALRVAPPVIRDGRLRVVVDLPGARLGALEGPSLPDENGGILALRAEEDGTGARLTVDLVPEARYRVFPGEGGLLMVIQGAGAPAAPWAVAAPGQEPPRVLPSAAGTGRPAAVARPAAAESMPAVPAASAEPAPDRHDAPAAARKGGTATRAGFLPPPPVGWGLPQAGPVSAPWTLLLMALVLGTPLLAVRLGRRRQHKTMPAPQLHTAFPDGTRGRYAAPGLAAARARSIGPLGAPTRRAQPPAAGRAARR